MTKPTAPLKALIWSAVSTIEQADNDKFSLDAQVDDALAIADQNNWQVVDTIRIEGHSRNYRTLAEVAAAARSKKKQELGFDRLITHLENGDFDLLICRDANRFARKTSLLYEIVDTILEDCHARIYSLSDGMVDTTNADMWLMVKGYELRKQMNWIKGELVRGRYKLVDEKGFPQGRRHVWSHMRVRDEKFKTTAFVPDPSKTEIIRQAARLVVDRTPWQSLELRLFERGFGINGQPFKHHFFYKVFNNPWFWGDAVRNYRNPRIENGGKIGKWVVDPSEPVPEGVVIRRAVNQPALTGDLALQLKAELLRRLTVRIKSHKDTHLFSGLLMCKYCGYKLVYRGGNKTRKGYACHSKDFLTSGYCEHRWYIAEKVVRNYVNAALEWMLNHQSPYHLIQTEEQQTVDPIAPLTNELAQLEEQIRRLIQKQAAAPDSLANMYDDQIKNFAKQREHLTQRIEAETRHIVRYNLEDVQAAYQELTTYDTLAAFWTSSPPVINQLLRRLMGNRVLVVADHKIIGSADSR